MPALDGLVAIVTGGGSGIGAVIARTFAREGAKVIVAGRTRERLAQVAGEIRGEAIVADVTDEASVASLFEKVGNLDILVNNAGIAGPVANASEMDAAGWDETMAINVRGAILCIKHAVPRMRARGGGSIINM